ncbi:MAG: M48 family metalloprotease [Betaproteobacteria bacterium]|nr:M48 family metalloprotease [Betaproteobacteria bacterium]
MTFSEDISRVSLLDGWRFLWTALIVSGVIGLAALYKIRDISHNGGTLIAEQLGGRMIMRDTSNPAERRCLNVIDEMSIAAGIPAPVAFVLDNEPGLNAFAAGLSMHDSVIGVTRGLLEAMNRDELQGIVAHEISHIVNGDSRLNLKLIGFLNGIYFFSLLGSILICKPEKNIPEENLPEENLTPPPMFIFNIYFGYLLYIIGSVGLFFGRLLQATISREREYLADAAAVQFTRNPAGLISALTKLHTLGSRIQHPEAMVASHLFFGASDTSVMASLFATHPPLTKRIVRLGGDGVLPTPIAKLPKHDKETIRHPAISALTDNSLPEGIHLESLGYAQALLASVPGALLEQAQNLLASLPEALQEQAHHISGAIGILAGLLFSKQTDIRARQEKLIPSYSSPVAQELYQWLAEQPEHGAHYRLVWFDLALPALREAKEVERQQLLILAKNLIRADGRVSPTEFALYSLLRGALLQPSERRVKRRELRLEQLDKDISDLLALLAYAGHDDVDAAEAAYQAAIENSPASTQHPLPAKNELSLNKISDALSHLALSAPLYRKKLLDACAVAVQHDGRITPVENELLRAFAQSLDCPAPMLDAWQQAA